MSIIFSISETIQPNITDLNHIVWKVEKKKQNENAIIPLSLSTVSPKTNRVLTTAIRKVVKLRTWPCLTNRPTTTTSSTLKKQLATVSTDSTRWTERKWCYAATRFGEGYVGRILLCYGRMQQLCDDVAPVCRQNFRCNIYSPVLPSVVGGASLSNLDTWERRLP